MREFRKRSTNCIRVCKNEVNPGFIVVTALAAGVPFFRPTVVSDLFFTAVAFGSPYVLRALERMRHAHSGATA